MATDPLTFAQEALGCREHTGIEHGGPTWPCLTADALAALIEARDCEVRADECEAIAAELSDEHREALFLGGANQPGTWGSVAARFRARADMHRGEPR